MNQIIQIYKKRKISIIAYIVFLFLWYKMVTKQWQFKAALSHINEGEKVAWGEGLMYGELLILALGIGTTLVCLINALINKQDRYFYLLMALLMIVPTVLFLFLTDFLPSK